MSEKPHLEPDTGDGVEWYPWEYVVDESLDEREQTEYGPVN